MFVPALFPSLFVFSYFSFNNFLGAVLRCLKTGQTIRIGLSLDLSYTFKFNWIHKRPRSGNFDLTIFKSVFIPSPIFKNPIIRQQSNLNGNKTKQVYNNEEKKVHLDIDSFYLLKSLTVSLKRHSNLTLLCFLNKHVTTFN